MIEVILGSKYNIHTRTCSYMYMYSLKCNETLQQPNVLNYKERHAYIHRIRSKYSPAGASTNTHAYTDTKIYYVIRYRNIKLFVIV